VDIDAVTDFNGDLAEIFMGPVHGISELQGRDFLPAFFFENLSGFFRTMIDAGVLFRVFPFA
jgi:hypothetical protein